MVYPPPVNNCEFVTLSLASSIIPNTGVEVNKHETVVATVIVLTYGELSEKIQQETMLHHITKTSQNASSRLQQNEKNDNKTISTLNPFDSDYVTR